MLILALFLKFSSHQDIRWITIFTEIAHYFLQPPKSEFPNTYSGITFIFSHYTNINLNDFEVENIHDHLSFYDGNSSSSSLIEQ